MDKDGNLGNAQIELKNVGLMMNVRWYDTGSGEELAQKVGTDTFGRLNFVEQEVLINDNFGEALQEGDSFLGDRAGIKREPKYCHGALVVDKRPPFGLAVVEIRGGRASGLGRR